MQRSFLRRDVGAIIGGMRWSRCFATATLGVLVACGSTRSFGPPVVVEPRSAALDAAPTRPSAPGEVDPAPTPPALADARHLLNRLAFGPRPGEVERVARLGPERWVNEQLAGPEESPLLEAALVPHRSAFAPPAQLVEEWLGDGWEMNARNLRDLREDARYQFRDQLRRLATAELTRSILSSRQLEAVLTNFWANHFNVYGAKGFVRVFEGDYLERALRPHALGKFSDLLLATARHPAMLIYLDNVDSKRETGGNGKRRRGGVNENYARELLELHTLGVDGGYTQRDVQEVARILTGWSALRMTGGRLEFVYRPKYHDSGEKTALGQVFPRGGQEDEGVRLLALLARHPSTARHLARRLCSRFVADEPPPSCVAAAARAYERHDGEIREVVRAIVRDPSFWALHNRQSKLKTPLELVASAARALEARPDGSLRLAKVLEQLGEPLLQERVPTGFPDSEPEWASAGGMLARMGFAGRMGEGRVPGLELPDNAQPPEAGDAAQLVDFWGQRLLGAAPGSRTLSLVREQVESLTGFEQKRAATIGLLLGSPEFQRQ